METQSNKDIVLTCYKKIIGQLDISLVDQYVDDNYIQHSPTVPDGKAGLLKMLDFLKTLPRPAEIISPIVRTIAEGDLVAVQLDVLFMGKRMAVVDIFRVQNGKLAEHWDASQEIAADNDQFTSGSINIDINASVENTRRVATEFFHGIAKDDHEGKIHRLITEGDFAVAQSEWKGIQKSFVQYDIVRVEGNGIAERWSVVQDIPETMMHSNGMI